MIKKFSTPKFVITLCCYLCLIANIFCANNQKVFVMSIKSTIDPRMSRYVKLALEEADLVEANYVVIEMDTYGGQVNSADKIRSLLLDYSKPLFVFINKNAASAGALIAISCDSIYMSEGANIGAATVVSGKDGSKAPDKYQSYFRSIMRSTAEAKGRDPIIAEAMVDESISIEGISEEGKVITFTTSEAIKNGFCEDKIESIDELLEINDLEDATIIRYQLPVGEEVIRFFLNPIISGLLILIIIAGLYFEIQTPGVGFPILASITATILYFVPYYFNGLLEYWEILLFITGILLIGLEIFVIPGFGILGIAGILFSVLALGLSMIDNDWFDFRMVPVESINQMIVTILSSMVGGIILIILGVMNLTKNNLFQRVILTKRLSNFDGYSSSYVHEEMKGMKGVTYSVLRPSGKIIFNQKVYDGITRGEFIEKNKKVIVIDKMNNSLLVREHIEKE